MARKELILCDACGTEMETKPEFMIESSNAPRILVKVNVYLDADTSRDAMDVCAHCVEFRIKQYIAPESA